VGARSKGIPNTFVDEILLAFMFSECLGSSVDPGHPNQAILVPRERIPLPWKEYTEAGVVRIQEKSDMEYRLWKPYNFLMNWMRGQSTVFEFEDVEGLSAEITSSSSAPDKKKGYCFQRARMLISIIVLIFLVALELVNPQVSKFWELIINELKTLGLAVAPIPLKRYFKGCTL
jgi:hypothetical protein